MDGRTDATGIFYPLAFFDTFSSQVVQCSSIHDFSNSFFFILIEPIKTIHRFFCTQTKISHLTAARTIEHCIDSFSLVSAELSLANLHLLHFQWLWRFVVVHFYLFGCNLCGMVEKRENERASARAFLDAFREAIICNFHLYASNDTKQFFLHLSAFLFHSIVCNTAHPIHVQ